jgi:hypothetical protein
MTVGLIQDHKGATLEQYDQVVEKMGITPGGRHLPGCLFHWESREQFDRFAEEQIAP